MNKNIIIGGVAAFAVVGTLFFLGQRAPASRDRGAASLNQQSAAVLDPSEQSFDFGTVPMSRGTVSRTLTFKNTGNVPVGIARVYTSCMCTSATLVVQGKRTGPFGMPGHGFLPTIDETVAPGEEIGVEVAFDPAAHGPAGVGRIERAVFLEGAGGRLGTIGFAAFVTP